MTPEQIKDRYEERIIKLLNAIREPVVERGLHVGAVVDMHGDVSSWLFNVQTALQAKLEEETNDPQGVDVSFTIAESEFYDGEEGGVNFTIDIVSTEGEMVGGITPFNYTPQVWVPRDDVTAVEQRFALVERTDPAEAVELICAHLTLEDLDRAG